MMCLVVMGGDSCAEGHGFESWHSILDGHFFTFFVVQNCNVCLNRPKINNKRGRGRPIFFKKTHPIKMCLKSKKMPKQFIRIFDTL